MAEVRIRVALAVVHHGRILLVPHYDTDAGPVQWIIPGGRLAFGEALRAAAAREFTEETGLTAQAGDLLDVSEVLLPERPYHSLTITFRGTLLGGTLAAEAGHPYGQKLPRWFSAAELAGLAYHPPATVERALTGQA
ncbi:MAG: NUDIX domain-containing protein [Anaerolineae bacterium]